MNNLKEARKHAKMTQKEVAEYIGISQNTYSYWENGRNNVDSESIKKLADLFGVSVDYLLDRDMIDEVNPETLQIAKRIIERRTELNITREELAEKIGVSKSTMQRYESGAVQHIPFEKLEKIADALNTTVATLSGYEEEEKKADVLADIFSAIFDDEDIRTVITALVNIKRNDPENFRNIATLIMGLSK